MTERVRLTERQFADIAAACDRLLRAPGTSLARLAIPVLHFLNEHPSALEQYAPVLSKHSAGGFFDVPRAFIRAVRGLTRSLSAPHLPAIPKGPIDVLIVSHLLNPQQLQQRDDFYFGALQSGLQDAGVSSLLVLIDHLPAAPTGWHIQPLPNLRWILPNTVPLTAEANIWRQCVRTARALRREAAGPRDSADCRLAMLASRQALAASTLVNLRMHEAIADICRAVNPKTVITTYEGTVAERLIWHAARSAKRRTLCVGYQHAAMLERAHAIRRPVAVPGLDCDPDVVLTLGEITHEALAASPGLQGVRFIRYGSHRRVTLPMLPEPQHRPRRCLVLPDASDRECIALFDFALASAGLRPDVSFALRPHPMVDTRSLLRRHPQLQKLPQNVQFSVDGPLDGEFAQARYCLYRGSSAVLHAVRAGIKPYYLAQPGELPIDCLFALADWRETVTSPADLADRISRRDSFTDSAAVSRAIDVCERYVSPVRPAAIGELLAMAAG